MKIMSYTSTLQNGYISQFYVYFMKEKFLNKQFLKTYYHQSYYLFMKQSSLSLCKVVWSVPI